MAQDRDEILGKAYDLRLLRRIAGYVRRYPALLIGSLGLLPLVMFFDLLQPKIFKDAIDLHIARGDLHGFLRIVLTYLGALMGQYIFGFFQIYFLQLLGQRATNDLRLDLFRHVLSLRMAFFDRTPVGKLMTRVSSDVEAINEAFAAGLVTMVSDFVRLAIILVILLRMDARLTAIALATAPLLFGIAQVMRRFVREAFRDLRARLADLNAFLQEHLSGMKIVQLFSRQKPVDDRFEEKNRGYRDANYRAIRADSVLFAIVEMVGSFAIAALLLDGSARIVKGTLTIGLLAAFIQYMDRLFTPMRDLSTKYTIMQSAMAAAERIFGLLDTAEADAPRLVGGGSAAPGSTEYALEMVDVTFGYREGEPILHELQLKVRPGETIAIVGSTGAGKSTLIKLLARLYEAQSGQILVGGIDVRTLAPAELRRRLVVISQDVFLFSGTLEENLSLGLPDIGRPEIEQAARRVGAERIIASRPGGLDYLVAERGANFSMGERQLLAFTRALARDPQVLILDEATASIDPETERLIQNGIEALMRGRTSLVIAHRLSTIERADRIVVLHKGRVAEEGSHAELLARGGLYAKLYRLQVTAANEAESGGAASLATPAPASGVP